MKCGLCEFPVWQADAVFADGQVCHAECVRQEQAAREFNEDVPLTVAPVGDEEDE